MNDRSKIKAKAFVVFQKGDKVLMHEVLEHGELKGYRLPGGHIEFGERAIETAVREIREELSAEAVNLTFKGMIENIFVYEEKPGHEVVFVYTADFKDNSLYDLEVVPGHEPDNGFDFPLYWIDLDKPLHNARIFPTGLVDLLKNQNK